MGVKDIVISVVEQKMNVLRRNADEYSYSGHTEFFDTELRKAAIEYAEALGYVPRELVEKFRTSGVDIHIREKYGIQGNGEQPTFEEQLKELHRQAEILQDQRHQAVVSQKYPEARAVHKKLLALDEKIEKLNDEHLRNLISS